MTAVPEYWHGGAPGLTVGSPLLSPRDAAAAGLPIAHTPRDRPELGLVSRNDRVYFSTSQDFARAYAFQTEITTPSGTPAGRGTLYRVHPRGPVEEDPDFAGHHVSWCAPAGVIVEIVENDVRMRERDATRAIGRYSSWDDGRSMYLEDGRLCVTWQMERAGFTQDAVDELVRPWTPVDRALERINAAVLHHRTAGRAHRDR
ncbi:hypothetical protein ACPW96_22845 [Micromonospora sp. DT81.3]|uniref:hypothetical protein n=1 Tax=Micromonospora sp. DT81.3 TaxID=3416523 RepID=UPI003CE82DA0